MRHSRILPNGARCYDCNYPKHYLTSMGYYVNKQIYDYVEKTRGVYDLEDVFDVMILW